MARQYYNYDLATLWTGSIITIIWPLYVLEKGGGDTQWRTKDRRRRQRQTDRQRQSARECKWETGRQTKKKEREKSKTERGRESEKENTNKHVQHILCYKMEWNIIPKVSPCLLSISSTNIKEWYYIPKGHPQHTIKPNFHSVSLFTVIFYRARGSSNLVVYSKQYTISV